MINVNDAPDFISIIWTDFVKSLSGYALLCFSIEPREVAMRLEAGNDKVANDEVAKDEITKHEANLFSNRLTQISKEWKNAFN